MFKVIKHAYKSTIFLADIFDLAHMPALKESANQTLFSTVSQFSRYNSTLNIKILLELTQNCNLNPKAQLNIHGTFLFIQTYPWKTQFWNDHYILGSRIMLCINVCFCHSCCSIMCTHKYTCEYAYVRLKAHLELQLYFLNLSLYPGYESFPNEE